MSGGETFASSPLTGGRLPTDGTAADPDRLGYLAERHRYQHLDQRAKLLHETLVLRRREQIRLERHQWLTRDMETEKTHVVAAERARRAHVREQREAAQQHRRLVLEKRKQIYARRGEIEDRRTAALEKREEKREEQRKKLSPRSPGSPRAGGGGLGAGGKAGGRSPRRRARSQSPTPSDLSEDYTPTGGQAANTMVSDRLQPEFFFNAAVQKSCVTKTGLRAIATSAAFHGGAD